MNVKVTGKLRAEFEDGDVKETEINGRAVFYTVIEADKEDIPENQEAQMVALIGATNPTEYIERVADAVIETLGHMAKEKVPAGVLYYKLMDRFAEYIIEKADDTDKELLRTLMGD